MDTNPKLAARYHVSSVPTLVVFRDGREVARHLGVTPEAVLREELTRAG